MTINKCLLMAIIHFCACALFGDPDGTRTHDTTVKGWCLNRLTTGPCVFYTLFQFNEMVVAVRFELTTFRV